MRTKAFKTGGVTVMPNPAEPDTVTWINETCAEALPFIHEQWGLAAPEDCRLYVMTSWWGFIFRSAPWLWRIGLAATLPVWCWRARRTWPYSAAWTQRYGRRVAIGVKPPRLLESSDRSIGRRVFEAEPGTRMKIRHLVCHELTHACSAHLKLPMWLNEGLAAVTVDRFLGKRTIRVDTLALVKGFEPKAAPPTYRQLSRLPAAAISYHAVRGYWFVHYLEATHPGLLRHLLSAPRDARTLEAEVAGALALEPGQLWSRVDDLVAAHFEEALAQTS
jgi:hypothetical protein